MAESDWGKRKGGQSRIAAWALKSYADMIIGFHRRKKEALAFIDQLPEFGGEVTAPDSDTIFSWIEELCATPHRRAGTPEGLKGEDYVAEKFHEFGLEEVTRDPIDINVWSAVNWELSVQDDGRKVEIPSFRVTNTAFTGERGITAPLVYMERSWLPGAFKRKDVRGKIVVANVPFPTLPVGLMLKLMRGGYGVSDPDNSFSLASRMKLIFVRPSFAGHFLDIDIGDSHIPLGDLRLPWDIYWNACDHGALGVVLILSNMISNSSTHCGPYDSCMKPLPALWVGKHDGERLRSLAKQGATATLVLEGEKKRGVTHNIWGILPGVSEEKIVIQSHHDAPFKGATEDGCGVGQVMAQAWAWSRVPRHERPKTLLFLCTASHFYGPVLGTYEFVKKHAHGLLSRATVVICLEHLGAKQVVESGKGFSASGELATTWIMTSKNEYVIASLIKMLREHSLKRTVAIPSNLLMPVPPTDAFPYPFAGVEFLSWISQPYYLLSAEDTLDKIEVGELGPIAASVTDLVKTFMVLEGGRIRQA